MSNQSPGIVEPRLYFNAETLEELNKEIRTVPVDGEGRVMEVGYTDMFVRNTVSKLIADHRTLLEENERLAKERTEFATSYFNVREEEAIQHSQLQQLREELEQVKKERDEEIRRSEITISVLQVNLDAKVSYIEFLESQQAEKDKVLEWYADEETYEVRGSNGFRDDIYVFQDKGSRARSVLSQYKKGDTNGS